MAAFTTEQVKRHVSEKFDKSYYKENPRDRPTKWVYDVVMIIHIEGNPNNTKVQNSVGFPIFIYRERLSS